MKNLEVSSKADDNWCDNGHYAKSQMVSVGKFCMIMESQQSQVQSTLPGEVLTGSQRQNRGGCRNWSNSEWLPLRKSLKKWGFQRDWCCGKKQFESSRVSPTTQTQLSGFRARAPASKNQNGIPSKVAIATVVPVTTALQSQATVFRVRDDDARWKGAGPNGVPPETVE